MSSCLLTRFFIQIPFVPFHTADQTSSDKEKKAPRRREGTHTDLDHTVVDGCVLLLSQHYQGDDNDGRYDDTSYHQANNSTLVRAHILSKENLTERGETGERENVRKEKNIPQSGRQNSVTIENVLEKMRQMPSPWVYVTMPT